MAGQRDDEGLISHGRFKASTSTLSRWVHRVPLPGQFLRVF